jgi:intracellular septation protein
MKFLFDLFPVILFFIAFKVADIYVATGVAVAATLAQVGYLLVRRRRVEPMLWVSLVIIVVFGGATLVLHDESFIKWKPTILYWAFALALGISLAFFGRNLIRSLMGTQLTLPDPAWRVLNWAWTIFFALMGALNLWVAFNFSTDTWVSFKLFGATGLMVLFVLGQGVYLARVMPGDDPS